MKKLLPFLLFVLVSCSPWTKEMYLNRYQKFMRNIEKEYSAYNDNDWKITDKEFHKLTNQWYEKFKTEFTFQEKLNITKYKVQYQFYRNKGFVTDIITNIFGSYDDLKRKVQYYVENNMEQDITLLKKEANDIGGLAIEMLNKALNAVANE